MIKKHVFSFVLAVLLAFMVKSPILGVSADEHLWLYVDGKYIKTSSYADPPNEIFVAAGVANRFDVDYAGGPDEEIVKWAKDRHSNSIRLDIYGYREYNFDGIEELVNSKVDAFVQACKNNQIYVYLDCHEYFHQPPWQDGWLPMGPLWDDALFQKWYDFWVIMATKFKDEPWVLGYELCNEPHTVAPEVSRYRYTECIKAIRQVDTRHIVLLGNDCYTHTRTMPEVWKAVNFRPDEPYNQAVFAFHEYTNSDNTDITQPTLDYIQQKFDVPIFCTEFGDASVVTPAPTEEMKRKFEKDMFAMFRPRYTGWSIWVIEGHYPDLSLNYEDIWVKAAENQASKIPVAQKTAVHPLPARIDCGASSDSIPADGESISLITAVIKDTNGYRLVDADNSVTFSLAKGGTLEGDNPVKAVEGIATIKLKSGHKKGKAIVSAGAEGLTEDSVKISITKLKRKKK